MDSRLMNVIYDDPFDGNYTKYDNDTEFWSSGSDTMGMQLTETLHGILPIAPTDDFRKDDNATTPKKNLQNNKNSFNYGGFSEQHFAAGGAIEIVSVDPNANGYDTDSDDEEEDEDSIDGDGEGGDKDFIDFERQSQSSNLTFRTRTDSSSIGDYESHTSDYDEDDTEDDNGIGSIGEPFQIVQNTIVSPNESFIDIHSALVATDDLVLNRSYQKHRTLSTNTINSDVDGLDLNIDGNNFDLAEFITKDDFTINNVAETTTEVSTPQCAIISPNTIPSNNSCLQVISAKHLECDSDSDVIVDVETVELDDEDNADSLRKASELLKPVQPNPEEDITYVDNVSSDPSWCPNQMGKKLENLKMEDKSSAQKQNFTKNFTLVPNKKQCDILKGKFSKVKAKPVQKPIKNNKTKLNENLPHVNEAKIPVDNIERKTGIGMGGKNLALLKHVRCVSISENSSEENSTPVKCTIKAEEQPSPIATTIIHNNEEETPAHKAMASQAVKRKLNLEEYKKRRGDPPICAGQRFESYKIPKLESKTSPENNHDQIPVTSAAAAVKHSDEVTSIVKTLKEQQQQQQLKTAVVDPITEAKNKVLRMQELKKAQQMRIIDSTISAKVPRVTKLLPLREIVKDTPYSVRDGNNANSTPSLKSHPDYEEIIVVSASCNTEISLPPILNKITHTVNTATRSLLKSSALLSSISNSFQKVKATDNVKISTNSLIASIQDVVVKKSLPSRVEDNDTKCILKDQSNAEEHGEDKVIMHLRKDRLRKRKCTIGIQTDLQPEFPPLPLPKSGVQHKSRERVRRKHRKHREYRKHKEQSSSSNSENSSDEESDHSSSSSLTRSHDNSCSSSVERMRTYDSAIGTGGYSSRSSRKHRSSISSSHSESIDRVARGRRQRRTSFKHRSKRSRSPYSSSSYTSDSDRSRSPLYRRSRSRSNSRTSRTRRSSYRQYNNNNFLDRNVSQPAVEERRIVYVGRIEQETTKDMLRRKFLQYGTIKQISIHYKDTGMKYGFVTFERSQDAFTAIDSSARDHQINMYDVSFGGRRAFCRASYADLDNAGINTYQSFVFPQQTQQPKEEDSFEALLMKMKAKLSANKKPNSSSASPTSTDAAANTVSAPGANADASANVTI